MDSSAHILALADRCVKCGLCLPQCPTYNLAENENESPRGRIALIQGWLTGQLEPSATLTQHLDQCLLCRRCERVCPSQVPYGEIMDQSKALLADNVKTGFSLRTCISNISLKLLLSKTLSNFLFSGLRFLQRVKIISLVKKSKILNLTGLQRLISYLPALDKSINTKNSYPAGNTKNQKKGKVALFTGCVSKQLDPKTVQASIKLLNLLGYSVYVPEQQTCCGALHLHDGKMQQATKLANKNIRTFNQLKNTTTIISLVNGCTSQLREYSQLTEEQFIPEVKDIVEFLSEVEWPDNIEFKALNKIVALQIPCSLQNSLRAENKLMHLIKTIPGISIETIYNKCCGAAGSYFLRQPTLSDQLKKQAITQLTSSSPEYIISSNLGCALQLKSSLSDAADIPRVIHPVELLAQQITQK